MNYKRSLIGVLVVGVAGLLWALSSDHVRFRDIVIGPLHNHDEPVIIEDGSGGGNLAQAAGDRTISVNFDLNNDTPDDPGTPVLDDEIISRHGAHPVVRVRMWVDGTEFYCGASQEKCLVEGGAVSLSTNERPVDFVWNEKEHGLSLISRGQKIKQKDPKRPSVFTVENPAVAVDALRLKKKNGGWSTYPLRTPNTKKITVHLCFLDDPGHCDNYSPK